MEPERDEPGEVLIVTGMSGAGRSTVANALEDLDWYVVDNLPPQMLRPLLELTELAGGAVPRVAVVVDVRGRSLFRNCHFKSFCRASGGASTSALRTARGWRRGSSLAWAAQRVAAMFRGVTRWILFVLL